MLLVGAPDLAENKYQEAVKVAPSNPKSVGQYAFFLVDNDRPRDALLVIDRSEVDVRNPGIAMIAAQANLNIGNYAAAADGLSASYQKHSTKHSLIALRGVAYSRLGNFGRAYSDFSMIGESDLAIEYLEFYAYSAFMNGEFEHAAQLFDRLIEELGPEDRWLIARSRALKSSRKNGLELSN